MTDHLPLRSTWDCTTCGALWPCAGAKVDLAREYRSSSTSLSVYLAAQLYEAVDTLTAKGDATPADLYSRFLSWARPAHLNEAEWRSDSGAGNSGRSSYLHAAIRRSYWHAWNDRS